MGTSELFTTSIIEMKLSQLLPVLVAGTGCWLLAKWILSGGIDRLGGASGGVKQKHDPNAGKKAGPCKEDTRGQKEDTRGQKDDTSGQKYDEKQATGGGKDMGKHDPNEGKRADPCKEDTSGQKEPEKYDEKQATREQKEKVGEKTTEEMLDDLADKMLDNYR